MIPKISGQVQMPLQIRNKYYRGKEGTFKVFKWGPNFNKWERRKMRLEWGQEGWWEQWRQSKIVPANWKVARGLHTPRLFGKMLHMTACEEDYASVLSWFSIAQRHSRYVHWKSCGFLRNGQQQMMMVTTALGVSPQEYNHVVVREKQ